jgi:pimeloyl-ACP methyl ester carboxylesterase
MPTATSHGERLDDVGRGITLCSDSFGDPADPPVLLVMGLGMQLIHWPEGFVAELVERGLFVVRVDNRDRGRSTHLPQIPPPGLRALLTRRFAPGQYTLADMAQDTVGLLDALALGSVHLVGASMGGMIAQTVAASHPQRVRSLVSIMSSTGSRRSGQPALGSYRLLLSPAPRDRDGFVAHQTRVLIGIGSPGAPPEPELPILVEQGYDRDPDPSGTGRQLAAILASGDRTAALRTISAPTLVIHGSRDRLVTPSGGRATARAIPGARMLTIPGMGHDLPRVQWPRIATAIAEHVAGAERAPAAADRAA